MINRTLIRRYTRGLISAISDDDEFKVISGQLIDFQEFIAGQDQLQQIFFKSVLPISRKKAIGEELIKGRAFHPKVERFLSLLVGSNRLELLADILDSLPDMWNIEQGVTSFEISSVISLTQNQKKALQDKLERMEKRPVSLTFKLDPDLIGGVSIRQGHIIYDASIKGSLIKLQENILEG